MSLITIFFFIALSVLAFIFFVTEPSTAEKKTRERLSALSQSAVEEAEVGIVREVTFSRIGLVDRFLRSTGFALKLQMIMEQARLPWSVGRFFSYSVIFLVAGGIIGNWFVPVGLLGWIPGMILGILPLLWVFYKRAVRMRKLNAQLPEAVDLISRTLRAGYSLPSSFVMVADEMSDPLGSEFRRTADELNFGLPFREALLGMGNRNPIEDLRFLITAILIQKETGGNLIELLDKISALMRARIHLAQKVRVMSTQGRLSGAILVAMPFVMFVLLNIVNPGYTKPLFEDELGLKLIYGALVSMAFGVVVIRRIIKIKV